MGVHASASPRTLGRAPQTALDWRQTVRGVRLCRPIHGGCVKASTQDMVEVLRSPKRIFAGIRPNKEKWMCYTAPVESIRNAAGRPVPCPDGFVFVAFVNGDGALFHWGLEEADLNDPECPKDLKSGRFEGGEKWKQ